MEQLCYQGGSIFAANTEPFLFGSIGGAQGSPSNMLERYMAGQGGLPGSDWHLTFKAPSRYRATSGPGVVVSKCH